MQGLHLICLHRLIVFLKNQELGLSCKKVEYFELYLSLFVEKVSKRQTHPAQWVGLRAVKQHRNGPPLFSEGDKGDGGATDQRRFLFRHSPRKRGIQKYKQQQATHPAQWVGLKALISKKMYPCLRWVTKVQNLKLQMEELQWGFPIATPLSLNKLISINGK